MWKWMDQLGEYFVDSVGLLDEHKWIYDFQMTELFSLPIMTQLFPRHVWTVLNYLNFFMLSFIIIYKKKWISSLKKCSYKQLYELVASNDFDRTYVRIKLNWVKFLNFLSMFYMLEEWTSRAGCRIWSARKFKAAL